MSTATRSRLALVAALVFALGVASWQAALHWNARNPDPAAVVHLGETAQVGDATFRLDSFEIAPRLPAADPDQEWVEAPDGALLVLVVVTTEITGNALDPAEHYCDPTAVDAAGRQWRQDSDLGYYVERPAAVTCTGPSEDPVQRGEPLAVGYVFLVPDDAADTLVVDLALGYDDDVVRLSR